MNSCNKKILSILVGLCAFIPIYAQEIKDFESWSNFGFSFQANKKTAISLKYIVGLEDNSTRFSRSMFSIQTDHRVNKWLKLGFEYRYALQYDMDFHRFWLYASVKKQLSKKWDLSWRPLYQYDVEYFDKEYMQAFPTYPVIRNMISIKHKYSKKLDLYFYVDPYVKWKNHEALFYRFRYGPGFDYYYKKRLDLGLEFVVINEFNVKEPWSYSFLNIKCIYELPTWNKMMKKLKKL